MDQNLIPSVFCDAEAVAGKRAEATTPLVIFPKNFLLEFSEGLFDIFSVYKWGWKVHQKNYGVFAISEIINSMAWA